jgi:hypothetical protein
MARRTRRLELARARLELARARLELARARLELARVGMRMRGRWAMTIRMAVPPKQGTSWRTKGRRRR